MRTVSHMSMNGSEMGVTVKMQRDQTQVTKSSLCHFLNKQYSEIVQFASWFKRKRKKEQIDVQQWGLKIIINPFNKIFYNSLLSFPPGGAKHPPSLCLSFSFSPVFSSSNLTIKANYPWEGTDGKTTCFQVRKREKNLI